MTIRILIADDHAVVREGLGMVLKLDPELEVVGEAANGKEALRLASQLKPDVVPSGCGPTNSWSSAWRSVPVSYPRC